MGTTTKNQPLDGFGNHTYLEKQDKLRDIGIDIHTSQIVVVGGQSSGKSSLLESLTGFSFPRGQGLCTRYATQITLRRHPVKSIVISITPRSDAAQDLKDRLRAFRQELDDFKAEGLAEVMENANKAMGIRSGESKNDMSLPMFSDDILKVEISGPEQPHLTVIDVPGLFQVTDAGVTTENDRAMVEAMVRRYMENERTIVLAVMSCLADRATEGILQLAKELDPDGVRTVGVLTKADLAREKAVRDTLLQLVTGDTLKLGYFVVRNRGADEDGLSIAECQMKEKELFAEPGWAPLAKLGRTGVAALRSELQVLLTELARRELPKQRAEVDQRLSECRKKLEIMGIPKDSPVSQRECLIKLASRFERIVLDALDGRYERNPFFETNPKSKLITQILDLNEGFSDLIWKKGHTWKFLSKRTEKGVPAVEAYEKNLSLIYTDAVELPELQQIVCDKLECDDPLEQPIMDHIEKCYRESRGPELGTFGGTVLSMVFREQAKKWRNIVMSHVGAVTAIVHCFIKELLTEVFADKRMREELWDSILLEKLQEAYCRAKRQAEFLLDIELSGRPSTYNHYFNDNLQKARMARLQQADDENPFRWELGSATEQLAKLVVDRSNLDQVKQDIHDIVKSYYKVSRKRFVDVICRQVIDYFLLEGQHNPLKVLTPELIAKMNDAQLDAIAGEDAATRRERERLRAETMGLEAAMTVLRS